MARFAGLTEVVFVRVHIDYIYHNGYIPCVEKRRPHYDLAAIRTVLENPDAQPFTITALRNGLALGLTEPEMRGTVMALTPSDFYKSMTTLHDQRTWQDVYHGITPSEIRVYIKITVFEDDRPPVIQFKAL